MELELLILGIETKIELLMIQLLNDKKITGQFNLGKLEEIGTLTRLYEQVRIGGIQK